MAAIPGFALCSNFSYMVNYRGFFATWRGVLFCVKKLRGVLFRLRGGCNTWLLSYYFGKIVLIDNRNSLSEGIFKRCKVQIEPDIRVTAIPLALQRPTPVALSVYNI